MTIKDGKIRTTSTTGEENTGAIPNTRGGRGLSQSAFNVYLVQLGASRENIRTINDLINDLVDKAGVKQEDMSDKIALLKKVEIKFHELVEHRKVFNFFEPGALKGHEKEIKDKVRNANNEKNKEKNDKVRAEHDSKLQARIKYKNELVVPKHIRNTTRSKKTAFNKTKEVKNKTPPEIEEMRRYLGIVPEEWDIRGDAAAAQKE